MTILTGQGDGGFDEPFLFFSDSGRAIAIGDLDNDGLDDLVLATGLAFSGPDGVDVLFNSQMTMCGDDHCNGNEDSCVCPDDCGAAPPNEVTGATCDDGKDNDCDGFTDCNDPDCDGDGTCDEVDTDGDGIIDALDPDDDNDGVPDLDDPEPLNPDVCGDADLDGCDECAEDANGNGVPDACDLQSPAAAGAPHNILKNRYISIDPRGADQLNVGKDSDIRVTLTSTLVNGVTVVGSQWWANAPDADCIAVVGPTRPAVPPDWDACPTLHITGCPIIPTSDYAIVMVVDALVSDPPLVVATQAKPGVKWHGDCVGFFTGTEWTAPNGQTSIDDAVAAMKTFQNPNGFNATHVSVTDVQPNLNGEQINRQVNIGDVFVLMLGFQGKEYPGPDLTQCP